MHFNYKHLVKKETLLFISKVIMTLIIVTLYFMLIFKGDLSFSSRKILGTPMVLGILVLLWIRNPLNEKWNKIISRISFFVTPAVCYALIELFHGKLFFRMRPISILLNLVIYGLLLFILYVISNRSKISALILCWITFLFGYVSYSIYLFRGFAIVASDFTAIKTATSVAGEYQFGLRQIDYCILLAFIGFSVFLCKLRSYMGFTWKKRLIGFGLCIISIFLTAQFLYSTDHLENWGIRVRMFNPTNSYKEIGSALTLVLSTKVLINEVPEGYSLDKVDALTAPYLKNKEETTKGDTTTSPNLIVIMNEAYSDLKSIADFDVNEDYMPFFRNLTENTVKGNFYASVYGGNTANSEFEFLTGNTMAFFPQRIAPLQMYVKDVVPSINYTLKQQGYSNLFAMHPYKPGGWNRKAAYPLLGFDQFISDEDFEDPELVRNYISDQEGFNRIIEEYETIRETSLDPYYMFNVTMQTHGKYGKDYDNFPMSITITDEELSDDSKYDSKEVERYLNLIKITDVAFENLITYFDQVDEPTVIVMFGDHQPTLKKFQDALINRSEEDTTQALYEVPFIVWANYDIEEEKIEKTSLNYLSGKVFDIMDLKKTGYQEYLLDLSKEVPAITANGYWGDDGNFYSLDDESSPYYDKVQNYQYLQYNGFFDKKNRVNEFFNLDQ